MDYTENLLEDLRKLLLHKKSKAYYATRLNISEEHVDELLKELKNIGQKQENTKESIVKSEETDNTKGTKKVTLESNNPLSPKEIEKLVGVDNIYTFIDKVWSKSHRDGSWTYSILISHRKEEYNLEHFTRFLDNWKPENNIFNRVWEKNSALEIVDVELNIADFHLSKKTAQKDDINSKAFDYFTVIKELVKRTKANYNINKLVFPISNDFFHSDNSQNTTTNGTPQDVTVWYDEEYERGFDILANTINFLVTQATEVEVVLVQGNHDRTKGFYVAHALEIFFKAHKNIKFQRHHSTTKAVVLGNTFIGYHHGNSCKLEDLPLLFATVPEFSKQFGNSMYREIHTADKHHYMAKDIKGVRIQQLPSLSGDDRWHIDNNYVNSVRAGLVFVYHPIKGRVAEFESRI